MRPVGARAPRAVPFAAAGLVLVAATAALVLGPSGAVRLVGPYLPAVVVGAAALLAAAWFLGRLAESWVQRGESPWLLGPAVAVLVLLCGALFGTGAVVLTEAAGGEDSVWGRAYDFGLKPLYWLLLIGSPIALLVGCFYAVRLHRTFRPEERRARRVSLRTLALWAPLVLVAGSSFAFARTEARVVRRATVRVEDGEVALDWVNEPGCFLFVRGGPGVAKLEAAAGQTVDVHVRLTYSFGRLVGMDIERAGPAVGEALETVGTGSRGDATCEW